MLNRTKEGLFWSDSSTFYLTESLTDQLLLEATSSQLKRARINLHKHESSTSVHEMIVAICQESFLDLHKHPSKSESYQLLEGKLLIAITDDTAKITDTYLLDSASPFLRINEGIYHYVKCLSQHAIYVETTIGPFDSASTKYYPWNKQQDLANFKACFV